MIAGNWNWQAKAGQSAGSWLVCYALGQPNLAQQATGSLLLSTAYLLIIVTKVHPRIGVQALSDRRAKKRSLGMRKMHADGRTHAKPQQLQVPRSS